MNADTGGLLRRRWLVAVSGVVAGLVLGSVYGWSVFKIPLMDTHRWSGPEVGLTFTLTIFFIGLSAALGGRFVDRAGARTVATIAAVLFGGGTVVAGWADLVGSKLLLWLGYGVIAGIGNGLGYVTPIAVLVKWFPDKRGMITGLAVMGFGFGGALMGQAAPVLIQMIGVGKTLMAAGIVFCVVLLLAARQMVNPPDGWESVVPMARSVKAVPSQASVGFRTAVRMPQFYLLWLILFINVTAGVAVISNLSPMAQSQIGLTPVAAGSLILVASLFNGAGRIFWASLSDRIGRKAVFLLLLGTQVPLFLFLPRVSSAVVFAAVCCYILLCYGGGFATMPAFAADTFGPKNIGSIYGPILLAWGVAGVAGPMMMEYAKAATSSFSGALVSAAALLTVGFLLVVSYRKPASLAA